MKLDNLTSLSDDALLDKADTARSRLTFYNAADGDARVAETEARGRARDNWNTVKVELERRNLTARPGDYLL